MTRNEVANLGIVATILGIVATLAGIWGLVGPLGTLIVGGLVVAVVGFIVAWGASGP